MAPLDVYSVPIARIEYKIGDNERRRLDDSPALHMPHGSGPDALRPQCLLPVARSEKNPRLTILALAWRAIDYLSQEMKSSRL